jgi:glucosamine--fructose-6-phosphate aminotransferase (isomerizing)
MEADLREAPGVLWRQREVLAESLRDLAAVLKSMGPRVVITCARGSSANAAVFGKHLIERYIGIPVAAAAPSIITLYRRRLLLDGQLFLSISQSGRSDDLVECATAARNSGAFTVAIVNDTASPLAASSNLVLPMAAGPELSVAATKTFIGSLGALLGLVATWAGDWAMKDALERLPDRLASATELDWANAHETVCEAKNLITLGRGSTLAIAQEASLKLKEVCDIHAEAVSAAEFQHGHVALVSRKFPIIIFMPTDQAADGLKELAGSLSAKSDSVFVTGCGIGRAHRLATLSSDYPETDAVCLIQSFYGQIIRVAEQLGIDVDRPGHLTKITRTR